MVFSVTQRIGGTTEQDVTVLSEVLTIPQARTWQFRAPKNSETGREIGSSRAW